MHEFHLPDMTCGHCAFKVNVTLKLVLPRQLVNVKSGEDREALVEALTEAGYPPR